MKALITIIRSAIGWHFLYEGLIKLFAGDWSAASYLTNTHGFLSGFYHWLAASPMRLGVVDFLNVWGLILIGLALFVGLYARWASLFGAFLLLLYYFAYPPFGYSMFAGDGSVYIINTQLIEAAVLVFLFCYKGKGYGLQNFVRWLRKKKTLTSPKAEDDTRQKEPDTDSPKDSYSRREALKDLATIPVLGLLGLGGYRSSKIYGADTLSGATIQLNRVALGELKGELPKGKLGNQELTRLVAGGNLIGGWAHARDLIYAEQLFKAYNTEKKIFETLMLCEQAGINCINIGYVTMQTIVKYRKVTGGKIKVIIQVSAQEKDNDIFRDVKEAIDNGMDIIQMHGGQADQFARDNKFELIGKMLETIRSQGFTAGLGAHTVDTFLICEENGIVPDYYMSTLHHDNYWSAHPRENRVKFETVGRSSRNHNQFCDNMFCPFPDETIEFIDRTKKPVMGYKVLAAGAIHPKDGFNWAFENGADFICVGMFDFQVVDDVNICLDTLQNLKNRKRAWFA